MPQGGLGEGSLGGVSDHGTHQEDDPETWESLALPRAETGQMGSPSKNLQRADGRVHRRPAQKKCPPRRVAQQGTTEAATEEGETSEGRIVAATTGNDRQSDPAERRRPVSR